MKLIFIACFVSSIIAVQGFNFYPGVANNEPEFNINAELIKKFMDAVLERAKLAMRPGTNGNILKVMDPFKQDNIRFDLEALKYVVYDFFKVYSNN